MNAGLAFCSSQRPVHPQGNEHLWMPLGITHEQGRPRASQGLAGPLGSDWGLAVPVRGVELAGLKGQGLVSFPGVL